MVAAIMGGLMAVSSVQAQNLLLNPSFEEGLSSKVWTGYSSPSQTDVPSWFTPGATAPGDSGAEQGGVGGKDGLWAAYLHRQEPGTSGYAAQTTGYAIQPGDAFNLSFLGSPGYTFAAGYASEANATVHYSLYYGGTATTTGTVFADGYFDLGTGSNPLSTFSISGITAPGAAVGEVLGIVFYNSSGIDPFVGVQAGADSGSWIYIDNVSLSVAPVPEPTSAALLGLGTLTGILALRRRRA